MEMNADITKLRYNEHILPVPWYFVLSSSPGFHFTLIFKKRCKRLWSAQASNVLTLIYYMARACKYITHAMISQYSGQIFP